MKTIKEEVNWGIIGVGDVCEIKSGPAFDKVPHSKLVAVMRRNVEKAKDFAQRHGVPKYYDEADELINDPQINAIYIATPPAFHEEYTIQSIKAGKPVYVEKPVSMNASECKRMLDFSLENNIPVSVAHYRRNLPQFLHIKKLLDDKILGKIRMIDLKLWQPASDNIITQTDDNWRVKPGLSGGGLFHDLAPHQLDILYWLFGKPKSYIGNSINQEQLYNAPDLTSLNAVFQDNIYFQGLWSFNVPAKKTNDSCVIIGERGSLTFPFFSAPELIIETESETKNLKFDNPKHIQQPHIEQVVQYFRGDSPNPCSLQDALETMEMMDSTL